MNEKDKTILWVIAWILLPITAVVAVAETAKIDDQKHEIELVTDVAKRAQDAKTLFCLRIADNLDSLALSRRDQPAAFRDRAAGAEWFIVNAVRLCTGDDRVPDFGNAIVAGDDDAVANALLDLAGKLVGTKP